MTGPVSLGGNKPSIPTKVSASIAPPPIPLDQSPGKQGEKMSRCDRADHASGGKHYGRHGHATSNAEAHADQSADGAGDDGPDDIERDGPSHPGDAVQFARCIRHEGRDQQAVGGMQPHTRAQNQQTG